MIVRFRFSDVHAAWKFLSDHPKWVGQFGWPNFEPTLDIDIVKVNPTTNTIEDDEFLNTEIRFWLECGPWENDERLGWVITHDPDLDSGGSTFEEAIIELATLVLKKYGDYDA